MPDPSIPKELQPKEAVRAELDRILEDLGVQPSSPELLNEIYGHLEWGRLEDAEKALRLGRPDVPKDEAYGIIGRLAEKIPEVEGGRQCFLATAALGSPWHPDVMQLRCYRDQVLRTCRLGVAAIRIYELLSPPLARWVARSDARCSAVARHLIRPAALYARRRLGEGRR